MKLLRFIRDPNQPIDRRTAMAAMLMNQFATPGLGSLMAGKWLMGAGQLLMAVAGFLMLIVWFVTVMVHYYHMMDSGDAPPNQSNWLGAAGGIVFLLSWLWSLVTSLQLLNEARRNAPLKAVPDDSQSARE
jgi:hypothetical protein